MHTNGKTNRAGQTMVEYIIIVVMIAIAAIAIFGVFGDTIRGKVSGAVKEMDSGDNASAADDAMEKKSADWLKETGSSSGNQ